MKNLLFLIFILLISVGAASAQDKDTIIVKNDDGTKDTIIVNNEEDYSGNHSFRHHRWGKWNFDVWSEEFSGRPTISAIFGMSNPTIKDFNESLTDPGLLELKLGYTSKSSTSTAEGILKYHFRFLFLSNFSKDLSTKDSSNGIETKAWRFGLGRSNGYGYKFGSSAVLLYNSYSLDWSKVDVKTFPLTIQLLNNSKLISDMEKLNLYDGTIRFGTSSEGGIKIQIIPQITLDAGYERSVIFQRHLFWKWLGSAVIEAAGQIAVDNFVNEIMDFSPYAVPVVNFVLKNALSYGVYELRHEKMNWPFKSAAPLSYDQFKFGVTFVF